MESDQFLSVMDLYSTVLSASSITSIGLNPLDGVDYWNELTHSTTSSPSNLVIGFGRSFAVFDQQWKLIWDRKSNQEFLFDIIEDPNETQNLAPLYPTIVSKLKKLVTAIRR